jgi:elongator complex protein 1
MKNLRVFQTDKVDVDATIVGHCVDADNGRLLVITDNFGIYEVQGDRLNKAKLVQHDLNCHSLGLPTCIETDDVVLVEFIVETGSLLIVLKCGKFISIGVSSFSPASTCIYEHSKNLASVKLSPDQDLIALADQDNDVSILSSDCSLIHTSNALTQNDSVHKPVGVGWGSKETQFFGLDGRPSKEKQTNEKIVLDEDELANIDRIESSDIFKQFKAKRERSTVIDWRGDGQYLATLTYIQENDKHYLKVWNRNLDLQYMSEQLVTMERGLISWIPNGQYVCCAQRRDNRINEIAMFEKNGMVHQRITLPTFMPHLYIQELMWSPDSKILALVVVQFSVNSNSQVTSNHLIMLYTMQNFHYYLKYSSYLNCDVDHYSLRWNPIHHNALYVSSANGKCVEYNCTQTVDQCQSESTVVVVDSNKLLVTPFMICNVPPPFSAITLEMEGLISRIILNTKSLDRLFVLTSENKLYYNVKSDDDTFTPKMSYFINSKKVELFTNSLRNFKATYLADGHVYQNMTAINDSSIIVTRHINSGSEIALLKILEATVEKTVIKSIQDHQVVSVVQDSYRSSTNELILMLDDSSCVRLNLTTGNLTNIFHIKSTNERLYVKETQFVERYDKILTLTLDSTLYVNEHIIVSNSCTSFKISENFLIYTTSENMINFIPLDRLTAEKLREDLGAWVQPIENGGTLILVSEAESKVILQMPRGNLEIMHPRIMVLLRLTNYLDDCDYLNAMKVARRYRVDLNFLCDYMLNCDENKFYGEHLNKFANEVACHDPSLLNLFVAELSREDTIQGRYKSAMMYLPAKVEKLKSDRIGVNGEKVNKICSKIQLPLEKKYIQPRLLCLLKQEPHKTDLALKHIYEIRDKEEREAALKFVLYFVQVDQLFLDAISTHNTDIALMVAGMSSKDPKEYLALLDSFNAVTDLFKRGYMMELHIKRYEKAFHYLLNYLVFSETNETIRAQLVDLVVSKRIYKYAVESCIEFVSAFTGSTKDRQGFETIFGKLMVEIFTKYGDYLLEKRYYLEAGLAYLRSMISDLNFDERILDNAIKCFLLAGSWERCLAVVERYKTSGTKREETIQKISRNLFAQGDCTKALMVLQLKKDSDYAYKLVAAGEWHLADAVVTDQDREQLTNEIAQKISSDLHDLESDMRSDIEEAAEFFRRFKELVLKPQVVEHYDMGDCIGADSLSTVDGSETTSVSMSASGVQSKGKVARSGAPSIKTRVSSKSSKSQANRGKKKKKIQLKVGSRNEDMALVKELQRFIEKQRARQDTAISLLAADVEYSRKTTPIPGWRVHSPRSRVYNELLRERYKLAADILNALWPSEDLENSVFSVYKRFGRLFANGESVENEVVNLIMRPNFPSTLVLFEF